MGDNLKVRPPVWFWIISSMALIWNLLGVVAYLQTVYITDEMRAEMTVSQVGLMESTPAWVTAAFAIGVFGGVLGCLALLLRKRWATSIFFISLIGILAQMAHSFFMTNALEVYGQVQAIVMPMLVIAVGIALLFFARYADKRQWLA